MSIEISNQEKDGIEIVTLSGSLALGQEDLALRAELDRLVASGKTQVVFNLSTLSIQDSDGLCTLLAGVTRLTGAGGHVAIFSSNLQGINPQVALELETAIKIFETEQDAIESFFPDKINRYDVLQFVEAYERQHPKSREGEPGQ